MHLKSRPEEQCEIWHIRALERESAFLYSVFESHEGVLAFSTLPQKVPGYCELELVVPLLRKEEALFLMQKLKADVDSLGVVDEKIP